MLSKMVQITAGLTVIQQTAVSSPTPRSNVEPPAETSPGLISSSRLAARHSGSTFSMRIPMLRSAILSSSRSTVPPTKRSAADTRSLQRKRDADHATSSPAFSNAAASSAAPATLSGSARIRFSLPTITPGPSTSFEKGPEFA